MEAVEPAFSFPTAVATVERQEVLVVEMRLDFVKQSSLRPTIEETLPSSKSCF